MSKLLTDERVCIRVDAEGRVVRTPAIERLVDATRAHLSDWLQFADPESMAPHTRAVFDALREVDREAEHLGAIAAESSDFGAVQNKDLDTGVVLVGETRNPAWEPGSGAEQGCNPLSPANLKGPDRRCKK